MGQDNAELIAEARSVLADMETRQECGKHSLTVMDHAAWLQFVAWADQKGTEQ